MSSNLNNEDCKKALPSDTASVEEVDAWVTTWMRNNVNSTFFLRKSLGIEGRTMHILYKMFATIPGKEGMGANQKLDLMRLFINSKDLSSNGNSSILSSGSGLAKASLHASEITRYEPDTQLTTFTCFPKLPEELRIMIWHFASFLPRNVDVFISEKLIEEWRCEYSFPRFASSCPVPSILHVNHESRTEGLRHYDCHLECYYKMKNGFVRANAEICINDMSDTLCLIGVWDKHMTSQFNDYFLNYYDYGPTSCAVDIGKIKGHINYNPCVNSGNSIFYTINCNINKLLAPYDSWRTLVDDGQGGIWLDEVIFYDTSASKSGFVGRGRTAFIDVKEDDYGENIADLRKHASRFNELLDQYQAEYEKNPESWQDSFKRPLVRIAHVLVDGVRV